MTSPDLIQAIQKTVTIPVMAKCRIGHFVEAQILEALEVDFIDESEVLTPADEENHIDKHNFQIPFVCGARDLGEALRRIGEGAAMIRTKGEAGSGNIVEAVRHMRAIQAAIRRLKTMDSAELMAEAKRLQAPYELVCKLPRRKTSRSKFFRRGNRNTCRCCLMMQFGAESLFVGSGIFKSGDPEKRARAIVLAATYYKDPQILMQCTSGLLEGMPGIDLRRLSHEELFAPRGL